jgi:hypothetical protein
MTSHGHARARFQHALKIGNAHIALAAAADLKRGGFADALSLLLVIREDEPVLYDKAAVRWFARYAAEDRYLLLRDARELIDLLDGVGLASPSTRRTICLRHHYASVQIARGVPLPMLAAHLGHSKTTLTLDTYSHVLLKD